MKEDDKQHCRIVLGGVDCLVATGGTDLVESVGMVDENMGWASGHAASWTRKGTVLWWDVANKIDQAILDKVSPCRGGKVRLFQGLRRPGRLGTHLRWSDAVFHPRGTVVAPNVGGFLHCMRR